jgi:predicted kinase
VWAIAKAMVKSLFLAGHKTVVVDATNTTIKRQEDWNDVAVEVGATVKFKVFYDVSSAECKLRAIKDSKEFLIPVIERMADAWEHPPSDKCL